MKKLLLIAVITLPFSLFGQDYNVMSTTDILINTVLESTGNYLEHKNDVDLVENLEIQTKKDSIDWNDTQLIKWQIIEPKDSLKIIKI
jgi:hypothetical protein